MKRTLYFDGKEFVETKTSDAAFIFELEDNKLTIKGPEVEPGSLDKAVFDNESLNAQCGFKSWCKDRRALTRKNDGTGIGLTYEDPEKDFVAIAPANCQMKEFCQKRGEKALSQWLEAQEKIYGFTGDDEPKDDDAEDPKEEPEKEPEKEPEGDKDSKKEPEAKQPTPAPKAVTKLPYDTKDWTDDDIDKMFSGESEF